MRLLRRSLSWSERKIKRCQNQGPCTITTNKIADFVRTGRMKPGAGGKGGKRRQGYNLMLCCIVYINAECLLRFLLPLHPMNNWLKFIKYPLHLACALQSKQSLPTMSIILVWSSQDFVPISSRRRIRLILDKVDRVELVNYTYIKTNIFQVYLLANAITTIDEHLIGSVRPGNVDETSSTWFVEGGEA